MKPRRILPRANLPSPHLIKYSSPKKKSSILGFTTRVYSTNSGEQQSSVLLDNHAQALVFGNIKMLDDVTDLDVPHRFNGISASSGVIATQTGCFQGIKDVDYSPDSDVNMLSWSQLLKQGVLRSSKSLIVICLRSLQALNWSLMLSKVYTSSMTIPRTL